MKYARTIRTLALIALILTFLALIAYPVKAQGTATVTILTALGGSTSPTAGTYTYPDGTVVTLIASPESSSYAFSYWEISTSSGVNITSSETTTLTVSDSLSYTVEPVFIPFNEPAFVPNIPSPTVSSEAVVIVLPAVGGTTTPGAGTYILTNATSLNLTATPLSGWKFDNWVIGGYPLSHGAYSFTDTPTNNPYNVNHGYGYTYSYQPVFSLVSTTTTSSPTIPEFSGALTVGVVVALMMVLIALGIYLGNKRK